MELTALDLATSHHAKAKSTVPEFVPFEKQPQVVSDYVAYGFSSTLAESATQKIHRPLRPESAREVLKQQEVLKTQYARLTHKYSHLKKHYRRLQEKYHSVAHQSQAPLKPALKRSPRKASRKRVKKGDTEPRESHQLRSYKLFTKQVRALVKQDTRCLQQLYQALKLETEQRKHDKALLQTYAGLLSQASAKLQAKDLRGLAHAIKRL